MQNKASKSFFSNFKLRGSFLSVLALIQALLISLSVLFTLNIISTLQVWETEQTNRIAKYVENEIHQETSRATLAVMSISNNETIGKAFSLKDREALIEASQATWKNLKPLGLQQFQFNIPTPAGTTTFLRMHKPEEYGEVNATYRPTVVKCDQEKQLVKGLEQGKSGYGFRAVAPFYYKGSYLGCVEFGSKFGSEFLEQLNRNYEGKWSIVNLDRGVSTTGSDRGLVAFINQNEEESVAERLQVSDEVLKQIKSDQFYFERKARTEMVSLFIPVKNFAGDIVLYVRHNFHTDYYAKLKKIILSSVAICIFGLFLSTLIIVLLYRQITLPISGLVQETEKIKNFQLDEKVNIHARLGEIRDLVEAISSMKSGLNSFKKYVPAQLVQQLIQTKQEANVNGQRRELTVFFSDIANFTTISENLRPQELTGLLSVYLNAVTEIIMEQKGTVDKYIGDAVMAFWGAPLEMKNHASAACMAALQIQRKINELGEKWASEGKPVFHTRVGINTGEVIVGNMGSEQRLNYTVIGDVVNLASRLEGLNKSYKTGIIVSKSTYLACKDDVEARVLDFTTVKGKSEIVTIYELISEKGNISAVDAEFYRKYQVGVKYYTDKNWEMAIKTFEQLAEKRPEDFPTQLFLTRSLKFQSEPPTEDWSDIAA
jgi:class 3 adenylate cyclase